MSKAAMLRRGVTLMAAMTAAGLVLVPPAGPAGAATPGRAIAAPNLDWPQY